MGNGVEWNPNTVGKNWMEICNSCQGLPFLSQTLWQVGPMPWLMNFGNASGWFGNANWGNIGDSVNFGNIAGSSATSSSNKTDDSNMTPAEKLAEREEKASENATKQNLVDKYNNLYSTLEEFGSTLSETTTPKKSYFDDLLKQYKTNVNNSMSADTLNEKISDLKAVFNKYKTQIISKSADKKGYRTTNYSAAYYSNTEKKHYYFDENTYSFKELFDVKNIDDKGNCTLNSSTQKKSFEEAKAFSNLAAEKGLNTTNNKYYYSVDSKTFYSYNETKKEFVAVDTNNVTKQLGYRESLYDGVFVKNNPTKHYYIDNSGNFKELFHVSTINADGKCNFSSGFTNGKSIEETKSISEQVAELKLRDTRCPKAFYSGKNKQHYYYDDNQKKFVALKKEIKEIHKETKNGQNTYSYNKNGKKVIIDWNNPPIE